MVEEVQLPFVARFWGVYTQPTYSEERFLQELERRFDGDWIRPGPGFTPEQIVYRKTLVDNIDVIAKYQKQFWSWKAGKRVSQPIRPDLRI